MSGSADGPSRIASQAWRLEERAFVEIQRADTKAAALCGVAGAFLAAGVAALSGLEDMPLVSAAPLVLMCALLVCAVGAALFALRPVVPRTGLWAELAGEAAARRTDGTGGHGGGGPALARLADRKLRSVRLAIDLVLIGLSVAGMGLLSGFIVD
ncbi:hypothetical protein ACFV6E_32580 [Streptomyces sp. NPDC059785]|uniref:hypothetical protein n=1 Tax=Streptomyces sp. NPDC059785 TaxID=3346945 RepID=UPI003666D328